MTANLAIAAIVVTVTHGLFTAACLTQKQTNISIYNVTSSFHLEFPNKNDIFDYNLTAIYTWKIDNPDNEPFDGFLIRFIDIGETSGTNQNRRSTAGGGFEMGLGAFGAPFGGFNDFPPMPSFPQLPGQIHEFDPNYCKGLTNNLWTINSRNESVQCQIPCEEYLGIPCNYSSLCRHLDGDGYVTHPKDQLEFSLEISFGRKYNIDIFVYHDWNVHLSTEFKGEFTSPFCLEETIETHEFNASVARDFCEVEQNISKSFVSAGPVLDVHIDRLEATLADHTASAYIKFKAPHDVATDMRLDLIYVNNHMNGHMNSTEVKVDGRDPLDQYYTVPAFGLRFNQEYTFTLQARVIHDNCVETDENPCTDYLGAEKKFSFYVPDVDGCENPQDSIWSEYRYCNSNATCIDNGPDSDVPAECTCTTGFVGNGVSTLWDGEGCVDDNRCDNSTCVDNAACTDLPPPSLGVTCECKEGYFGDGYENGSKCTSVRYIVSLAVALPVVFLIVVAVVFVIWRYKLMKKRTLELALSKFIVTSHKETNYFSPMVISNNRPQGGAMADAKWEVERENIVLGDVLGRGNFGIVYKSVLKMGSSERVVAVKMTPPTPSSDTRSEFLAEISLIATLGKHENILGVVGCCTKTQQLCLVLEYMKYGDLLHFLWDAREAHTDPIYDLTEREMCQVGWQVANGMSYLRKMKIIHGDIAARNILVGENLVCKISDFGLANDVYRYGLIKGATERRVPYKWISPERMMMGKVPITWKSDVWSFGILLYEMITLGGAPYFDTPQTELFSKLQTGYRMARPSSCSMHLYNIMSSCWDWTPSKRPSFEELQRQLRNVPSLTDGTYVNLSLMVDVLDQHTYAEVNQERSDRDIADIPANDSAENVSTNNNEDVLRNEFAV